MSKNHKNSNYKKIWKDHYGIIPKDENGRNFHIHHVDGNPQNNDISNLKAVSEAEHAILHESNWILWASKGHKFWTEEGKKNRKNASIFSGKKNYENKIGIFDPVIRQQIDELNSKSWRIISPSRNLDIVIKSLNKWCAKNKVSRSGMNCAYINGRPYNDYYLLQIEDNETLEDRYKKRIHKNSKSHFILNEKTNEILEITNLVNWCKNNNINREGLKSATKRKKFYNGYILISKPYLTGEKPIS